MPAYEQAAGVVRPGGVISRVGVPQYENAAVGFGSLFGPNVTLTGGPAPVRAYIERLLPAVLDGTVDPGRVFDRTVGLEDTPEGYRAMDAREALKVRRRAVMRSDVPCSRYSPGTGHPPPPCLAARRLETSI